MLGAWSSILGPNLFQFFDTPCNSRSSADHWPTLQLLTFNVIFLVKKHHIFFSKVLSKKIQTIAHDLPAILVITEARRLIR